MVESQVVEFVYDYTTDEDEGKFYSTSSKNMRGGIGRAEKGGGVNEALEKLRDVNSKPRRAKKILVWGFYYPYEKYGKETDLKWYLCIF